jgi:hypothetical protein
MEAFLTALIIVGGVLFFVIIFGNLLDDGLEAGFKVLTFPIWFPFWLMAWGGRELFDFGKNAYVKYQLSKIPPSATDIMVHMIAQRIIKLKLEDCISTKYQKSWIDPETKIRVPFSTLERKTAGFPIEIIDAEYSSIKLDEKQGKELYAAWLIAGTLDNGRKASQAIHDKENLSLNVIERLMKLEKTGS